MLSLGYDIGSSQIKIALVDNQTGAVVDVVRVPEQELDIISRQNGWAEQNPDIWWQNVCRGTKLILSRNGIDPSNVKSVGVSYQMHGLVLVDENLQVLRPAIIWCDSRAVSIGKQSFEELGKDYCLNNLLNSPGNFTASKLKWIKDNEPGIYSRIHKVLLPGDYIAMQLTGQLTTTVGGLSEAVLWNFSKSCLAHEVLEYFGIESSIFPDIISVTTDQLSVSKIGANSTGLSEHTLVSFRAGDQPNNAMSLNVLEPGQIAASSGTSGVVYGVVDKKVYDAQSRINMFTHVNYDKNYDKVGVLLCINGAGVQYAWLKNQIARSSQTYEDMERMVASVPVGSGGICVLPFGNGAERMFGDKNIESHIFNIEFNRHSRAHMYRASLEGVAFSFVYGIKMLKDMGISIENIRVGNDNMFRSRVFSQTISTLLGVPIEVYNTTGAVGAARASGIAAGIYTDFNDAFSDLKPEKIHEPILDFSMCSQAYNYWLSSLEKVMNVRKDTASKVEMLNHYNEHLSSQVQAKSNKITQQGLVIDRLKAELNSIKAQLSKGDIPDKAISRNIENVIKETNVLSDSDNDMNSLASNLKYLNSDFTAMLLEKFPKLQFEDIKLAYLLQSKISSKEISSILGISLRGVETRRYRLRKKFSIPSRESISDFLDNLI